MSAQKIGKFINRNLVAIVIVPTIIGLHWVCDRIQNNEKFVRPEERQELPVVRAAKHLREEVLGSLRAKAKNESKEQ